MDIEALVSKYFGWCPGIKSASKFVPRMNISLKRRGLRAHHICLAMVLVIITFNAVFILQTRNFIDRASVTQGRYIDYGGKGSGGIIHYVDQRTGKVYTILVARDIAAWEKVDVLFDPENPGNARINAYKDLREIPKFSIVPIAFFSIYAALLFASHTQSPKIRFGILPIILGAIIIGASLIIHRSVAKPEKEFFTYLDDVTIRVDERMHQSEGGGLSLSMADWESYSHVFPTFIYRSPLHGVALECMNVEDGSSTLHPRFHFGNEWSELNVTWYARFPGEGGKGDEVVQQCDVHISDIVEGKSLSRVSAGVKIENGVPHIRIEVAYLDDSPTCPPDYHDDVEVDFTFDEWHKITILIVKPRLIVFLDDEPVIEASISPNYLGDGVDFRWRSFYS
jgi:hypothetical protein